MAFSLSCDKTIFTGARVKPAKGSYPSAFQVEVSSGGARFHLESDTFDFAVVLEDEPVAFTADVIRVGGGSGFHVVKVVNFQVLPAKRK